MNEWLSVNWFKHHRRSAELGSALGAELHFIRSDRRPLPVRYVDQWRMTRKLLRENRPSVVQIMQPPVVALVCVALTRRSRSSIIIGDLHTGVFSDPKWRWASPLVLCTLRRRGFAVVPNEELAEICRRAGVEAFVSHGFIRPPSTPVAQYPDGHVLVPLTYAFDEPVAEILGAAALLPERRFVLTGNAPQSVRQLAPDNVDFPGFVSAEDYSRLLGGSGAVLALTNQEMTMQSAGYEALATARPLITSPRRVLQKFFGDSAVYTESNSELVAKAVQTVFDDHASYCSRMTEQRDRQVHDQLAVIEAIKAKVQSLRGHHEFRG